MDGDRDQQPDSPNDAVPNDPVFGDDDAAGDGFPGDAAASGESDSASAGSDDVFDAVFATPEESAGVGAGAAEPGAAEPADDGPVMVGPGSDPRPSETGKRRDPVGATIRGIGQVLITAGVVVLLFVVYELWITNLFGEQRQAEATATLDKLWAQDSGDTVTDPTIDGGTVVVTKSGDAAPQPDRNLHYNTTEGAGFAKMYVPAFGADFVLTVIEGTAQDDLYAGPGHYQGTQYPGQAGNFALAGHRVNKGAPFDDLGLLDSCDAIVVETESDWYVYRVLPMENEVADWATSKHAHCAGVDVQSGQYQGVYGREITSPTDIAQIRPVPHVNSTAVPADAESLITLTTCHPKFSDRERMIIHGILVKHYPKAKGFLPPQLQETS